MAKTALTQLQDQIEAVRREAYQAGFAAAMAAIRDFAARSAPESSDTAPATAAAPTPKRRGRPPVTASGPAPKPAAKGRASRRRPQRGANAQMIAEVLQAIAPRAARPAEIRETLQRDKGIAIAFTSIRHALGQLAARQEVEQADAKTWRYLGAASSPP